MFGVPWPVLNEVSNDMSHNLSALTWGVSLLLNDQTIHDGTKSPTWACRSLTRKFSTNCPESRFPESPGQVRKVQCDAESDVGWHSEIRSENPSGSGGLLPEDLLPCDHRPSHSPPLDRQVIADQTSDPMTATGCGHNPSDTEDKGSSFVQSRPRDLTPPRQAPRFSKMVGVNEGTPHPPLSPACHHRSTDSKADLFVKIILLGDYSVGKSSLLRVLGRHGDYSVETDGDQEETIANLSSRSSFRGSAPPRTGTKDRRDSQKSGSLRRDRVSYPWGSLVASSLKPGGFVEVEFTHQGKTVLARISDTGGQERYRSMTTSYYRGAHGCLLLFDVTKEESFVNLDSWLENIDVYHTSEDFPVIIVGTRCQSKARRVVYERAEGYAQSRKLPYMELDMDHMTDVRRVFDTLLDRVTVNLWKRAHIGVTIRPEVTNQHLHVRKGVFCSC